MLLWIAASVPSRELLDGGVNQWVPCVPAVWDLCHRVIRPVITPLSDKTVGICSVGSTRELGSECQSGSVRSQ